MDDTTSLVVSGVLKDIPSNSSFKFDFLISFELFRKGNEGWLDEWGNNNIRTFIQLSEGTDVGQFNVKFKDELDLHNGEDNNIKLFTQRFSESYLYSKFDNGQLVGGRIEQVKIFSVVAVLILLIACINFMNLATAQASKRAKEVGMRKVIGAQKEQLIGQFLGESIVFTLLAAVISLGIVALLLPAFNSLSEKSISLNLLDQDLLFLLGGVVVFTGLLSGSYPAMYLSRFEPAAVLKGAFKTSKGAIIFRKSLVVFQFMLSIILIVSTLVVYRQFQYTQDKQLGFNRNNVFFSWMKADMGDKTETIRQQLMEDHSIEFVGLSGQHPISVGNSTWGFEWPGKDPEERILFSNMSVNPDFVDALGLEIIKGRNFDQSRVSDTANFIINETAAKKMRLDDPVGQPITMWETRKGQIIGVVKDYHFRSLHREIEPLVFFYDPSWRNVLLIRHKEGMAQQALAKTEQVFKQYAPSYPFEFEMVASTWNNIHQGEKQIMELFQYFAGLSIFISCLGLFGLAAFSAEQRTKEIGIRKILGASMPNLTQLMIKDFALLVLIASTLACPLAWYLMNDWLQDFVYRIEVGYVTLLLATLLAFIIAVATVSYHALRASILNPVRSLRYE